MKPDWFQRPDWPMDYEIERRNRLIDAIRELPNGESLSEDQLEQKALFLWKQANFARQDAQNCNLAASQSATDKELRRLHSLCEKLAEHIESMHAPAITALANEGFFAIRVADEMRDIMEGARHAFGACEGQEVRGRRPDIEASQVSEIAGLVYQNITDKRPTCTTDPLSGNVSGGWPDFLQSTFEILLIKASVAAQARTVSETMREKSSL